MSTGIEKYDEGAYHWESTHHASFLKGFSPPLLARYLLPIKIISQEYSLKHARVLDLGCGDGAFLKCLQDVGTRPVGVELSKGALSAYHQRSESPAPVIRGSIFNLPVQGSWDIVTMLDVIEHLDRPEVALNSVRNLLKQYGICVATTPILHGTPMSDYHDVEFTTNELGELFDRVFDSTTIIPYAPMEVYHLYTNSIVARQLIRVVTRLGFNPMEWYNLEGDDDEYRFQIAIGRVSTP